jgi:uncharacterized protein
MIRDDTGLPLPKPTPMTRPFWQAAHEHRLAIQRCDACGRLRFYPSAGCHACASARFSWTDMSGRGRVYSWIVVRRTAHPAWQSRVPFVSAIVELAEQPGLLVPGLLTDVAPEAVRADLDVHAWFEDLTPDISVPRWRPAGRPDRVFPKTARTLAGGAGHDKRARFQP